jgi:hypothetical protein
LAQSYSRTLGAASVAPNGHSQEATMLPFGAMVTSRALSCESSTRRGLYCVARDEVASFDFETGEYVGAIVNFSDLFGQALEFFG